MIRRLAVISAALLAAATPAAAYTNTDAALPPSSVGYQPKDALEKGPGSYTQPTPPTNLPVV